MRFIRALNRSHWQHNDILGFHLKIAATLSNQWGPLLTPNQRHRGEDRGLLKQRDAVYEAARQQHPERWSGNTRNWTPVIEVWLNPPQENQPKKGQNLKAA